MNDPIMGVKFGGNIIQDDAATRIAEIQRLETEKAMIANRQKDLMRNSAQSETPIWDSIDAEISPMSEQQRIAMQKDKEYVSINSQLADMVQVHLLQLVRGNIEKSPTGKELLSRMLEVTRRVKGAVLTAERTAMEEFEAFRKASEQNPDLTMAEFRQLKTKKK